MDNITGRRAHANFFHNTPLHRYYTSAFYSRRALELPRAQKQSEPVTYTRATLRTRKKTRSRAHNECIIHYGSVYTLFNLYTRLRIHTHARRVNRAHAPRSLGACVLVNECAGKETATSPYSRWCNTHILTETDAVTADSFEFLGFAATTTTTTCTVRSIKRELKFMPIGWAHTFVNYVRIYMCMYVFAGRDVGKREMAWS